MKEYDTFELILFVCTAFTLPSALWPVRPAYESWNAMKSEKGMKKRNPRQKPIPRNIKTKQRWRRKVHQARTAATEWRQLCRNKQIHITEEMTLHGTSACACLTFEIWNCISFAAFWNFSIAIIAMPLPLILNHFLFCYGRKMFYHTSIHRMQFWWAPFPSANRWTAFKSNNTIEYVRKRIQWAHYPQGSSW